MKTTIAAFYFLIALISFGQERSAIQISTRWLGEEERAALSKVVVESYSDPLHRIREGIRSSISTRDRELQLVIKPASDALEAMMERGDTTSTSELLPFIDWLHLNQGHPLAGLLEGEAVKGTLNYLVDGIFEVKLRGGANAVGEREMESMLRFYAGNPAQTSEGSWHANNTLLFVFGNRVVDCLGRKAPDRVAAFYQAVQDARKAARLGPDPEAEPVPEAERPTSEQLLSYEAAFARLEMLATQVASSTANPAVNPQPSSNDAHVPLHRQPLAPQKPIEQSPAPSTPREEPVSSTRWPVVMMVAGAVAALGLLGLLLKKWK